MVVASVLMQAFPIPDLIEIEKERGNFGPVSLQSNPGVFAAIVREPDKRRGACLGCWIIIINMRCWV